MKWMILFAVFFINISVISAQTNEINPIENISNEITKISQSVQNQNKLLKDFLEKFGKTGGFNLTEKQQKLLLGFEILNRAEQRLATLQKFQIELVEKQVSVKTRLVEIEREMRPESVDRSVAFVGTTKTEELRENRRQALTAERNSLQAVLTQIQNTLSQTNDELIEAQRLVYRLRRSLFPQIEQEISDL